MDDIVLRGMAKWPDVPAVYGWLSLSRRGQWLIKGDPITNPAVSSFIGRNYDCDGSGQWFFQNGPQRVFVQLDYTPFVYRAVDAPGRPFMLETHTGCPASSASGVWIDDHGVLLVQTEHGVGVVHDHDLETVTRAFSLADGGVIDETALEGCMERLQAGEPAGVGFKYGASLVTIHPLRSGDVPRHFGFIAAPNAPEGHPECT